MCIGRLVYKVTSEDQEDLMGEFPFRLLHPCQHDVIELFSQLSGLIMNLFF